jgi:hypothetical protein
MHLETDQSPHRRDPGLVRSRERTRRAMRATAFHVRWRTFMFAEAEHVHTSGREADSRGCAMRTCFGSNRRGLALAGGALSAFMMVSLPQGSARSSEIVSGTPAVESSAVVASKPPEAVAAVLDSAQSASDREIALDGYEDR